MNNALIHRVSFIFKRHFMVPPALLKRSRYLDDLGLSKVEQKEMLNYLEEEFHIELSEQDERRIRTVNDTLSILDKYIGFNQNHLTIS